VLFFAFVLLTLVGAAAQLPYFPAPAPYLEPTFLAPAYAAPNAVVAGNEEPGERLVVTGRVMDGDRPVASASVYLTAS
jgi:protocatechuate 3,4-dioxygenase beta subunit